MTFILLLACVSLSISFYVTTMLGLQRRLVSDTIWLIVERRVKSKLVSLYVSIMLQIVNLYAYCQREIFVHRLKIWNMQLPIFGTMGR